MNEITKWLRKLFDIYIRRDSKRIEFYRYQDSGGELLRLDYPLAQSSIVLDVGGYIGDFAEDIVKKYNCKVDVFEPVKEYADRIRSRFLNDDRVRLVEAGLGDVEKEEFISIDGLASSVFLESPEEQGKNRIKILSGVDYIRNNNYEEVGLMKINIEGGEYELLPSLLDSEGLINKIKYLQIQFHDFIPDAVNKRAKIRERLTETHDLMWDYPFIWESWKIKE